MCVNIMLYTYPIMFLHVLYFNFRSLVYPKSLTSEVEQARNIPQLT